MANLYPKIQIFDFVPRIQVWSVTPDYIDLFWFPIKKEITKSYKLYVSTSYTGPFNHIRDIPNNPLPAAQQQPYTPGAIYVKIPKSELGYADIIYYFKATSIAPDGTEIPPILTNVPVKPVFTMEEHRLKGRAYHRAGQTILAFQETIPPNTDYADNMIDLLYTLGRFATSLVVQVDDTEEIYIKFNAINSFPIRVRNCEIFELQKDDVDVSKIFISNQTASGANFQITATG